MVGTGLTIDDALGPVAERVPAETVNPARRP